MKKIAALLTVLVLAACSSNKPETAPVVEAGPGTPPVVTGSGTSTGQVKPDPLVVTRVDPDELNNPNSPLSRDRVIYFDYDSFSVKDEYKGIVDRHSKYLVANRTRKVFIEGHADARGSREYNLSLGQKRAEAVKSSLKLLGVPEERLEAVSFGKEKPQDPANTEAAFAKNRRAELNYR